MVGIFRSFLACAASVAVAGSLFAQPQTIDAPLVPADVANMPPAAILAPPSGPQVWAKGEYVAWGVGTSKLLQMAKESYNSDFFNAVLAAKGTDYKGFVDTLIGDDRVGGRFSLGAWADADQSIGVEAGFLYMNRGPLKADFGNRDFSPLARIAPDAEIILQRQKAFDPTFTNVGRPVLLALLAERLGVPALDKDRRQVVIPLADVNLLNADMQLEIAAKTLWMMDLLGRARVAESDVGRIDVLAGYRRVYYADSFGIRTEVQTNPGRFLLGGASITSLEQVRANNFYDGALVGFDLATDFGPWTFSIRPTATIAQLNATTQRQSITYVTLPDRKILPIEGGTFLRGASIGDFSKTSWTVLSEIGSSVSRSVGEHVRLTLGSSFMYLPRGALSSQQIDFGMDGGRTLPGHEGIPSPPPSTSVDLRSFFFVTFSFGVEFRY